MSNEHKKATMQEQTGHLDMQEPSIRHTYVHLSSIRTHLRITAVDMPVNLRRCDSLISRLFYGIGARKPLNSARTFGSLALLI